MFQTSRSRLAAVVLATLAFLFGGVEPASARRGREALKLRVNDAIARPGGTVAIVLRTYAARPIRQGQISVRVRKGRPTKALSALTAPALTAEEVTQPVRPLTFLGAVVYSSQGDSATRASMTGAPDSQAVAVQFASPSATVNAADGPLAVLRFRLDPAVAPGQQYTITVDPALTSLVDGGGRPILVEPIDAVLTVRAPAAPLAVAAEGDEVEPGEMAELGVQTFEPFRVSSGRVTLRFDPAAAGGAPVVRMDPRYGNATFTVSRRPGGLVVDFQSPDRTLNLVPGTIVAVDLPTRASAAIGTASPVTLDPAGTWLRNPRGRKLRLKLEPGSLAFE